MVYIFRYNNKEVTDFYLNIIKDAFMELGNNVEDIDSLNKKISKKSIIVVSTINDVIKCYLKGYHNVFLWMQGIDAEESYLKNNSNIRKLILSIFTYIAVRMSKGIFFVSNEMKKFIEKKYHISTKNNSFIMPCFNTEINKESFYYSDKYKKNIFAYVGSLSKWQCFYETIDLYKKIENEVPDAELRVYTFSVDEAKKILEEKNIKKYYVDKVEPQKISNVLKEVKFGFTIRDDNKVNNVATPTKFSSYLSAGVIPIFSTCIKDFYEKMYNRKYVIPIEKSTDVSPQILKLCNNEINADEIYNEYKEIFLTYYNRELYKKNIKEWLGGMLNESKNI